MPRASTAAWLDDVRAGTAAAVVSIGTLLPLGLLAVAALGPAAAGAGLRATFVSAIVGAAVACVVGGARVPFYQPRTSVTLIHAGLVAALAADPALVRDGAPDVALILAVAGVAVMLSGVLQVAFGAFRVGSLAKFVPMPVIAGFMDGVAILIALAQVPLLLGVGTWHAARDLGSATSHLFPAAAVVGLAVVAVSWLVARHRPRWPAALLGMAVGTLLYFGIDALTDAAALGPLIGAPAGGVFRLEALAALTGDAAAAALAAHWRVIVTTAVVLALVGSLDGLLAAMAVDHAHGTRHEPNRLLVGHGSSNLVAGALGGLPLAFSAMGALAIARAGGRTRAAVVVSIVILWLVSTLGAPALGAIPVAVTAGIMLFVALGLGHQWSRFLWRQLRTGSRDRDAVWSFAVVTVVAATTVVFGFFAVLIAREFPGRQRVWPYLMAGVATVLVAFARLYLGAHWLSDVIAGVLLGVVWVLLIGIAYRRHSTRSFWMRPLAWMFYGGFALALGWYAPRSADPRSAVRLRSAALSTRRRAPSARAIRCAGCAPGS